MVLTLVVGAAGCAREEAPAPPPVTPTPAPPANGDADPEPPAGNHSQGITDTEILIGSTYVTSGFMAFIGVPIIDTIEAVFARANAQGGIAGRNLRLIHYDDGNDPVEGRILMERLLEEDEVFMLTVQSGVHVTPSLQWLRDFGIPIVNITGGIAEMYSEHDPGGTVFNIQPSNEHDGPLLLARAISESIFGPNRDEPLPEDVTIGMVYVNTPAGLDVHRGVMGLAAELGIEDQIIAEIVTPETYATVIQQFMDAGVGVVLGGILDSAGFVAAMDDAGWMAPWIGSYGTSTIASYNAETYNPLRPIYANAWAEFLSPEAEAMLEDFNNALTYHPTLDDDTRESYADNAFAVVGYFAAYVIVEALRRIEAAGIDFTWDNFVWAMESAPWHVAGTGGFDFANGRRMGVSDLALFYYTAEPDGAGGFDEFQGLIRPFESVDEILAKRGWVRNPS